MTPLRNFVAMIPKTHYKKHLVPSCPAVWHWGPRRWLTLSPRAIAWTPWAGSGWRGSHHPRSPRWWWVQCWRLMTRLVCLIQSYMDTLPSSGLACRMLGHWRTWFCPGGCVLADFAFLFHSRSGWRWILFALWDTCWTSTRPEMVAEFLTQAGTCFLASTVCCGQVGVFL